MNQQLIEDITLIQNFANQKLRYRYFSIVKPVTYLLIVCTWVFYFYFLSVFIVYQNEKYLYSGVLFFIFSVITLYFNNIANNSTREQILTINKIAKIKEHYHKINAIKLQEDLVHCIKLEQNEKFTPLVGKIINIKYLDTKRESFLNQIAYYYSQFQKS